MCDYVISYLYSYGILMNKHLGPGSGKQRLDAGRDLARICMHGSINQLLESLSA